MLTLNIQISNLDYDSVVDVVFPIIKANPPELNFPFLIKMFIKGLLNNDSAGAKKILNTFSDDRKANFIVDKANANSEKIENAIIGFASKQKLYAKVSGFSVSKGNDTKSFNLNCNVEKIDYESFIQKFLPLINFDSSQDEIGFYLNTMLKVAASQKQGVVKIINAIDNQEKERFIAFMVNKNSLKIQKLLSNFIQSKGISVKIDSIEARAV